MAAVADFQVPELHTLIAGLVALALAQALFRKLPVLGRFGVPSPVVGGVLASLVCMALRGIGGVEVTFATGIRDLLLLVFFTTIGLSAKLSALRAGGRPLALVCAVVVALLVLQNVAGIALATSLGAHPFHGLLIGSISFVGGPGTALAWAKEGEALGLSRAPEVALGAATLAVVFGAIVAGPLASWLVARRGLRGRAAAPGSSASSAAAEAPGAAKPETFLQTALLIAIAVAIGERLNEWARAADLVLPGFLTTMLGGVLIANLLDLMGRRLWQPAIERGGEYALQAFLVLSLMSLQLWTIADALGPLLVNLAIQLVLTSAIAGLVLFPLLGRDYEAAVTCGGFLGFGLSSMPVAMATMEQLTERFGPAPRAFLLITLAGSFFVDLANALVVKAFLALPLFAR